MVVNLDGGEATARGAAQGVKDPPNQRGAANPAPQVLQVPQPQASRVAEPRPASAAAQQGQRPSNIGAALHIQQAQSARQRQQKAKSDKEMAETLQALEELGRVLGKRDELRR